MPLLDASFPRNDEFLVVCNWSGREIDRGRGACRTPASSNVLGVAVPAGSVLYGPGSDAALAMGGGVPLEVPVMLWVCAVRKRPRNGLPA